MAEAMTEMAKMCECGNDCRYTRRLGLRAGTECCAKCGAIWLTAAEADLRDAERPVWGVWLTAGVGIFPSRWGVFEIHGGCSGPATRTSIPLAAAEEWAEGARGWHWVARATVRRYDPAYKGETEVAKAEPALTGGALGYLGYSDGAVTSPGAPAGGTVVAAKAPSAADLRAMGWEMPSGDFAGGDMTLTRQRISPDTLPGTQRTLATAEQLARALFLTDPRILPILKRLGSDQQQVPVDFESRIWEREKAICEECVARVEAMGRVLAR